MQPPQFNINVYPMKWSLTSSECSSSNTNRGMLIKDETLNDLPDSIHGIGRGKIEGI